MPPLQIAQDILARLERAMGIVGLDRVSLEDERRLAATAEGTSLVSMTGMVHDRGCVPALATLASLVILAPGITWEAPPACPSGDEIERRLGELLRGSTANPTSLRAEAQVAPHNGGWQLRIVLHDRRGIVERRELQAAGCDALARAFALIVAVRIDALKTDHNVVELQRPRALELPVLPSPLASGPSEPSARRSAPRLETRPSPTPRPATRASIDILLRPEAIMSVGMLPGVGFGAGLMGGVQGRAWRVEAGAAGWPVRSVTASTNLGIRVDLITGRARVCWSPPLRRWRVPVCGGGELGGLRGVGTTGVAQPNARWTPWGAATGSVGAAWSIRPRIAPYAAVEGIAAFSQPRFSVGDQLAVQASAVGVRTSIGLELKIASRRSTRGETLRRSPEP